VQRLQKLQPKKDISYRKVYGESDDVNEENVAKWINDSLPGMNCGYEPRDIFNADETAPFLFTDARQNLDTER
jgi:hypothetical protein